MVMNFSTLDALTTLCTSIPDWIARLDDLNKQIANRQIELARLTEKERLPSRSLKNKGSTESLRPKDGNENPFGSNEENRDNTQMKGIEPSKSNGHTTQQPTAIHPPTAKPNGHTRLQPSSSTTAQPAAICSPPPPKASSNPRPSPGAGLTRQSSQPTPATHPPPSPAAIRKRKAESPASGESPKYRTRSMITIYYDGAVQTAFEELVKLVSGSRHAMRKGKMAAKMAEMRRAAELEVDTDDDDDVDGADSDGGDDHSLPKPKYGTTSKMRALKPVCLVGDGGLSVGLLKGYRRAGMDTVPDIFDDLDKGLEWCQGQCEHAAHQFLRDGDCSTEIENIKRKLGEVKTSAEKEIDKLKTAEAANLKLSAELESEGGHVLKAPLMRKDVSMETMKDLEVDDGEDENCHQD